MTWYGVPELGVIVNPGTNVGDILVWNGAAWVPNNSAPTAVGAILTWDGTNWIASNSTPSLGDHLVWTGTIWTAVPPDIVLAAWGYWDSRRNVTLVAGEVTAWGNYLGRGGTNMDLAPVNANSRPTVANTGPNLGPALIFDPTADGANGDRLTTIAQTLNQPTTVLARARFDDNVAAQTLVDGRTGNTRRLFNAGAGSAHIYGGNDVAIAAMAAASTWQNWAGIYNGASGMGQLDDTKVYANVGAAAASGLVVGAFGTAGGNPLNGAVDRVAFYDFALTPAEIQEVFNYWAFS